MKIQQIRNATLRLDYAGRRFLIDPMFADKASSPGFPGTARSHLRNPLVALPVPVPELIDVDAVLITHTHPDHWDDAAREALPTAIPIYTQNDSDAALIRSQGFTNVQTLLTENRVAGITIIKTTGQHGSDEAYANPQMAAFLGDACGLVFKDPAEKTLYIAGDTIWVKPYEESLRTHRPDVVVLNAGQAMVDGIGAIIMGKEDVLGTHQVLPHAMVIASHMEAVNHCILSRDELRAYAAAEQIEQHVRVPADGETLTF
ncbi:L-ascorbate metabolism protein UlaG (beta-lactamase superfamily) [Yokenella regensburgei]|uniref:L-ascorbate metabolism protein UlaG (Beta-lactamase superfamily) n=1 Tax=Yokenella regensburgei TaxID=158877 RepID=A0ABX9S431_9ENTR|nr:MBL fold metallo-hydrolase [Yokenella regensburgei]RKR64658.1 L-ascorbate metabolism protein UlaG (beta-lactamase superfamily) [Yokenella regensburgei]VFS22918.1 metal-dependent hydrolase [Yokenella regensburgei]